MVRIVIIEQFRVNTTCALQCGESSTSGVPRVSSQLRMMGKATAASPNSVNFDMRFVATCSVEELESVLPFQCSRQETHHSEKAPLITPDDRSTQVSHMKFQREVACTVCLRVCNMMTR